MSLYPQLEPNPQVFRLTRITEIQKQLHKEVEQRRNLYNKYKKAINALEGIGIGFTSISLGASIAGISLIATTAVLTPYLLPLEIATIGLCVFSSAATFINKKLAIKCKKHYEISVIAQTKLNTISSHISKALQDNNVSDEEFNLILSELDKYNELKAEARSHSSKKHASMDLDQKKILEEGIRQGKKQIMDQLKGVASDV